MRTFINILGGNASGKSTRVGCFVNYLQNKIGNYTSVIYFSNKKKKETEVGRIYKTKIGEIFILGRFNGKQKWVGLDSADFSTYQSRYDFIKYMFDNYNITYFIQEGYFNNRAYAFTLEKVTENGAKVEVVKEFFFLYDNVNQFLERTNTRTGKNRGLDWAKNAPGWRDSQGQLKNYNELLKTNNDTEFIKVSVDIERDYFVQYFFNETFDCPMNSGEQNEYNNENLKKVDILDDW